MKKKLNLFFSALSLIALIACSSDDDSCTKQMWYIDLDGDGYGVDTMTKESCNQPEGYAANNTDCNDTDASIYPGATDTPNDGIDSDCGGEAESIIWSGPNFTFTKAAIADWTLPANQDAITPKVVLTRQDSKQLYNYQWWQDNNGGVDATPQDLEDDFWDDLDASNYGGVRGTKWAILDDTGAAMPWNASFNRYGTLGDPTHFYSFHNIASMIYLLDDGDNIVNVIDNFTVEGVNYGVGQATSMPALVGKKLGVWLVEEDIYFTLTITEWGSGGSGGALSYTRSTP